MKLLVMKLSLFSPSCETSLLRRIELQIQTIYVQSVYVIRGLVGNNNNIIANCIFYLTEKSDQPEDGS
jgi:hypothetical protein